MSKPSLIGKRIDEYQLEEMLGERGMVSVYRARDIRLNRYVAIKVIRYLQAKRQSAILACPIRGKQGGTRALCKLCFTHKSVC